MEVRAVLMPDREEKRQNGRRMKDEGEPMFTLTAQDRHGVAIIDDQGRANKKLSLLDICPTLRAQAHGNEPKVIDAYNHRELKNGIVGTLTSNGNTSVTHSGTFLIGRCNDVRIRRLTPKECFRLQGFPDEYFDRAKAAGVSDSQLFKQAGNSVTVNVAYAIGLKLKEIENE